jgi:hypothetical protein
VFPRALAQSSLAEIRFSQMLPNPTWLNDWRNICRAGFPTHQAPRTSSFAGDVGIGRNERRVALAISLGNATQCF